MPAAVADGGGYVLSLDIGTSSARAVLYDSTGVAREGGPVLHRFSSWRTTAAGAMEADPEPLVAGALAALDAGVAELRARGGVALAVAVTAFWHGIMGLDAAGEPTTPVYAWGDTRAAGAAARLRERLDAEAVRRRTGCFLDASYPAARLLWLRESHPDIFSRASHWVSLPEYLGLRLFGELRCSLSMASATGLLDTVGRRWDAELLDAVGVSADTLSPVVELEPYAAPLRAPFAARWPELAGVPWFPALGDGACANLGSGAVDAGRPALTVGTTAAVRALITAAEPPAAPALWCYRLDGERWVLGRALSNGGNVVAALERMLRLPPPDEREAALAAAEPDGHGLTVLPWLLGERGPGVPPPAGAAVVGQTHGTRPIDLLQAWMESVALRVAGIVDQLAEALGEPEFVVAGGGALRASPAWRRMIADATGRPLVAALTAETSARGAALVALEQLGLVSRVPAAVPVALAAAEPADGSPASARVDPDPERAARMRAAGARQRRLAARLQDVAPGSPGLARPVQPVDGTAT